MLGNNTCRWEGQVAVDLAVDVAGRTFNPQIRKLYLRADFRVLLGPLVPVLPCFAAVSVSLVTPPKLNFEVNLKTVSLQTRCGHALSSCMDRA